jgi:hypothetical protein
MQSMLARSKEMGYLRACNVVSYLLLATTESSERWEEECGVEYGQDRACNSKHPILR